MCCISILIQPAVQEAEAPSEGISTPSDGLLVKDGHKHRVGDFVFLRPGIFDELKDAGGVVVQVAEYASKGRFHKGGANCGLRPYGIAQLTGLGTKADAKKKAKVCHS